MHLSASVQYTLKDRPEGYLGLTGEHIGYGRTKPLEFDEFIGAMIVHILQYYIRFQDADHINKSLDRLRKALETVQVVEEHPNA